MRKLVMSTKSKSCKLDPIPTTLLKHPTQHLASDNQDHQHITTIRYISLKLENSNSDTNTEKTRNGISKIELQTYKQSTIHLKTGGEDNIRSD